MKKDVDPIALKEHGVLPKEFRPPLWREIILVLNLIFFGIFLLNRFFGLKF